MCEPPNPESANVTLPNTKEAPKSIDPTGSTLVSTVNDELSLSWEADASEEFDNAQTIRPGGSPRKAGEYEAIKFLSSLHLHFIYSLSRNMRRQ